MRPARQPDTGGGASHAVISVASSGVHSSFVAAAVVLLASSHWDMLYRLRRWPAPLPPPK